MWRRMIGIVVLASVMVLPAMAQEEPQPGGWALRIGPWYPASSNVRDATSDFWVYFGVERNFPGIGNISLDYSEGSDVDRVRMFSLFLNARQEYSPRLDLLAGLGIVNADVRRGGRSFDRTRLGGTVGIATRLGNRAELQLRYQTGGFTEVNGFVLTFNFRF